VGRRSKARECAFQILYQWQITGERIEAVVASFWKVRSATPEARAIAERLARGAQAKAEALDAEIAEAATNWRLDRIAPVDRTILRLGVYELGDETGTPVAVVIDEAVELAKRFGDEGSPAFVNGVLDAIRKKLRGDGARDPEGARQER
jgi:transcription antitermination protein NusB